MTIGAGSGAWRYEAARTFPVALDGSTDLPPGKIATLVTFLEMTAPPSAPRSGARGDLRLRRAAHADPTWYRALFRRVGEPWLWFSRLKLDDAALAAILARSEVYVCERSGAEIGLLELDRDGAGDVEIAFFGLVPEAIGAGIGRWMMGEALALAWETAAPPTRRVWLHTCSFDHADALAFYRASGFRPYKLAIEVVDDPRLAGILPRTAAPHVPLVG